MQAGYSSQTCWYHLGSKLENTKNSVPGNSQTPSRIWLHSMVNHSKDQPTGPWQGPGPGTPSDHSCDAVHINHMERLTGLQPLGQQRDAKNMMQEEKFSCLTNHPMKTRLEDLTKNRLKRSSFVHESKKLSRQFHDRLPQSTLPFLPPDMSEPWVTDITDIKVHTTVPSLSDGDTQDDTVKQSLTLAMITERYPQEAWIHVFTDGSATNAVTNGGAGILVHFPGGQKVSASMAVGKHCSNYRAETEALIQAASTVQIMTANKLYSSLMPSPSCRHTKITSSQTRPKPYSKLQLPGGLFCSGFQPTVE